MTSLTGLSQPDTLRAYYPDLLATPVPRYTSFPTAVEFSTAVGASDAEAALRQLTGDVSLYLHIPFCEQICWYCGCNTGKSNKRQRMRSYLDALTHEIALVGERLAGRTTPRRVAFGGGSPNAITPDDFLLLIEALKRHLGVDSPEWSIELDPRSLTAEWTEMLGRVGVQQASLGVQTFAPALQAAIGRIQPDHMIADATRMLRAAGVTSLNFDLMYGLPGQTSGDLEATLARTIELGADRVALFGYAHVPHMLPRQRQIDASALPDQAERFAMAALGHDILVAAGYVPVGFDHFALPGDPLAQAALSGTLRRNFQGFTADQAPALLGFGASAISCLTELMWQNEKNAGRYRMILSQDQLTAERGKRRSPDDRRRGDIIEGLLCAGEATIAPDLMAAATSSLLPFIERGLAEIDGTVLRVLPQGVPYARTIAALFDLYRQHSATRFSSAV
jgi:oxygen-independent coproporphyrinogen-3 oxidase